MSQPPQPSKEAPEETRLHRLLSNLKAQGIEDRKLLRAMESTPRDLFVPELFLDRSWEDSAIPINCGQTISQPYIVALMTQALRIEGRHRVLEIGTGSGYQTAVLAELAGEVFSIERHEPLSVQAGSLLDELGYCNVRLIVGDGTQGDTREAPYTRILVAAAADHVPAALCDQLADGGILVMPVGEIGGQVLQVLRKIASGWQIETLTPCRFVPLVSEPD